MIQTWKHPRWERALFFLTAVIALALTLLSAVGLFAQSDVTFEDVFAPVFFFSAGVLAFALAESSISITSETVRVRNFYKWRVIPLEDISSVSPGYYGIVIRYPSGGCLLSLASQKSNYATWFKRRTQADEISCEILAAVRARKGF
ncbi:hypothetical protein E4198_03280 [Streptomyces sp. RKND-216]|uniref:hypothetical protein n=1 Tax=Streptomyces sp. RKND-216 TaxID=2562581 RepID=UPI00109E14B9|nr:hypothetical protein [Streptomyces sp. RKND-216]THA23881.1 hypothetical protein E4198_03280 [Streptomyces sp. RKND-216]